ncbi:SRPBCC family protein [Nocardia terpenica]|uniref:SRPBCC family protein n=1 Tax=Nocardia terpenica TaxID=455432 RepID=A0A6G9Z7I7_9NOCA|nr:SRPBCC family protein [Nocardia terpenica]QIS21478.1 SRPBCC family protein [Nocardia terpenica]
MPVLNVHTRLLPVPAYRVGELVETFGSAKDRIWPGPPFPPAHLHGPLVIGAVGGHGGGSYTVVGYQPERWLRFEFAPGALTGFHEFTIRPIDDDTTELRHTTVIRPTGVGRVIWPSMLRWLHDDCVESLLDRAEFELTGSIRRPHRIHRYSLWLMRLGVMRASPSPQALPSRRS